MILRTERILFSKQFTIKHTALLVFAVMKASVFCMALSSVKVEHKSNKLSSPLCLKKLTKNCQKKRLTNTVGLAKKRRHTGNLSIALISANFACRKKEKRLNKNWQKRQNKRKTPPPILLAFFASVIL